MVCNNKIISCHAIHFLFTTDFKINTTSACFPAHPLKCQHFSSINNKVYKFF